MLLVGLYAALLVSAPWLTASTTLIAYLGTIPFSMRSYRRMEERAAAEAGLRAREAGGGPPTLPPARA